MKTKILTMLAVAAGSAAAICADIYSLNVVGYANVDVPANQFKMIANQLNTTNNTVASLIPNPPGGTRIYKYNGTSYDSTTYVGFLSAWSDGSFTLNPGEGAFIQSPSAFTVTFVGEVMQGALTNSIPAGFSIRSSMVPQAGGLVDLTPNGGDRVYQWDGTQYNSSTYVAFLSSWSTPINVGVGESFFYNAVAPITWVRNFSAN